MGCLLGYDRLMIHTIELLSWIKKGVKLTWTEDCSIKAGLPGFNGAVGERHFISSAANTVAWPKIQHCPELYCTGCTKHFTHFQYM